MLLEIFTVLPFFCVINGENWRHSKIFDEGRYLVQWNLTDDLIVFQTEVKAKGYVGFGLSRDGSMAGSDIVIGWVKNGEIYFHDRHGIGNVMPVIDDQQDWHLLYASENDTHTVLKFYRKLQTCDDNDLEIDDSTFKLIYAYSDEDPISVDQIQYHFDKRGVQRFRKLRDLTETMPTDGLPYWDVLGEYHLTPDVKSMYWCKIIKTPKFNEKQSIIKAKVLISPGNENYVHHMALRRCNVGSEKYLEKKVDFTFPCQDANYTKIRAQCQTYTVTYAIGGEGLELLNDAAFSLLSEDYYTLEIHYDNSAGVNKVDTSGFRNFYSPIPRKNEMAFLSIGTSPDWSTVIPPQRESFVTAGHMDCSLIPNFPKDGIHIVSAMLHAHMTGRQILVRHFRNQTELEPVYEDKFYDFSYQNYDVLRKEVHVLPEDQLTVECTFNTMDRNTTTIGGSSTLHEMCELDFYYYPKLDQMNAYCFSRVRNDLIRVLASTTIKEERFRYESLEENIKKMESADFDIINDYSLEDDLRGLDWSKIDVPLFENMTRYSPQIGCDEHLSWVSYPPNFTPYIHPNECKNYGTVDSIQEIPAVSTLSNGISIHKSGSIFVTVCLLVISLNL